MRYVRSMAEPYADTLPKVATERAVRVERLRVLATQLERLPLEAAAEVLIMLGPTLVSLEREAALALERSPTSLSGSGRMG